MPGTGTDKWCNLRKYLYQYQYLKTVLKYSSSTSTITQYYNPGVQTIRIPRADGCRLPGGASACNDRFHCVDELGN